MLMVIFGAGASYDSVPSRPPLKYDRTLLEYRPPLANELFCDQLLELGRLNYFGECRPIIPYLRSLTNGKSIEQVLEGLREEAETYGRRHQQLAAIRYYLHTMLIRCEDEWNNKVVKGISNYHTLLDQLQHLENATTPVLLVSFNYDTMIESALLSVGLTIRSIADYTSSRYKLIKLHGSTNWAREVIAAPALSSPDAWVIASEVIRSVTSLQLGETYHICREVPVSRVAGTLCVPAVAIPVETKKSFECPSEHLSVLNEQLPHISRILTIGWRGAEGHFLSLLQSKLAKPVSLYSVTGSNEDCTSVINTIRGAGIRSGKVSGSGSGFSDFILRRLYEQIDW